MSFSNIETVTVNREWFNALLSRVTFNNDAYASNGAIYPAAGCPTAVVPQAELDELRYIADKYHDIAPKYDNIARRYDDIASKYENLKQNLLRGGVPDGTVELLSQDHNTYQATDTHTTHQLTTNGTKQTTAQKPSNSRPQVANQGGYDYDQPHNQNQARSLSNSNGNSHACSSSQSSSHSSFHSQAPSGPKPRPTARPEPRPQPPTRPKPPAQHYSQPQAQSNHQNYSDPTWVEEEVEEEGGKEVDDEVEYVDEEEDGPTNVPGRSHSQQQDQVQKLERTCPRTVQLNNLAEGTTHADITSAVRGGLLLDIFLRGYDRSAQVSFLHAADARKFLDHVHRHDLIIRNKRVDVKMTDKEFILPARVASRIARESACRNLVLYDYDQRHSEEVIRGDLDHIHNLVVIKVQYVGGNAYIELNSVHTAIFARECMLSRVRYKGKKILFGIDDCALPYPEQPRPNVNAPSQSKKPASTIANRFQLLNCGDDDYDDDDDDEEV